MCVKNLNCRAIFDLTESRFSFIVNLNLDSLANRMVWIRGYCRHFYCLARLASLVNPHQNRIRWICES